MSLLGDAYGDSSHHLHEDALVHDDVHVGVDEKLVSASSTSEFSNLQVEVMSPTAASDFRGDVVLYKVLSVHSTGSAEAMHRFNQFAALNEKVCEFYKQKKYAHLKENLPAFPSKAGKSTTDQKWIEQRRLALDLWLGRVVRLPHALSIPAVVRFLELTNASQKVHERRALKELEQVEKERRAESQEQARKESRYADDEDDESLPKPHNSIEHDAKSGDGAPIVVSILKAELVSDFMSNVIVYTILAVDTTNNVTMESKHRFQNFSKLDKDLRDAYKRKKDMQWVASQLPPLPAKKFKLFTNHTDEAFINQRKQALQVYLNAVAQLPGVSSMAAFRRFLELS